MGKERRRSPRANVNLVAWWEGASTMQNASITNLSVTGCFVLSGGTVETKELVRLDITFPDETEIQVWAEVVDAADEIGFAVKFNAMGDEERERLEEFMKRALSVT